MFFYKNNLHIQNSFLYVKMSCKKLPTRSSLCMLLYTKYEDSFKKL